VRSPDPLKREKMGKVARILFGRGNYVVLFEDETEFGLNPGIQRCWMPRGEQREVLTPGVNEKIHVFGAVDARASDVHVRITRRKNAVEFVQFLRQLLRAYPARRIYLVVDNWGMHQAGVVREFLAHHPRLVFVFLPSYAPLLNVIERLWLPAKARLTKNAVWRGIDDLRSGVERYFRSAAMRSGRAFKVRLGEWLNIRKDFVGFT
jgi:transposase